MTWRRNGAGSFILPINFYTYIDISGTDTTQWKILKVSIFSFSFISCVSSMHCRSCIMTKYSHLFHLSLKHSTAALSSGTLNRPIQKSITPGLKDNVNHMIVTSIIFLDLDLFRSLDYDTELIVRDSMLVGWDGDYTLASTGIWD